MELDRRSSTILQAIVEAYIRHAQPLSSAAIARDHPELELSPATIRVIFAELEAAGLVAKPHASSGRIPTERGLRTYLDALVSPRLRPWDRARLEAALTECDPANVPAQLGQTLADLAGQMVVLGVPRFLGARLREVGLVRLGPRRLLAYFVSPGGLVQQKVLALDFDLQDAELVPVQNVLNTRLGGRTLAEVRALIAEELASTEASCDALVQRAMAVGAHLLPDAEVALHVEGSAHLLDQPELAGVQLRALWRAVEEKAALLRLLGLILARADDGGGVTVLLGSEHRLPGAGEVACVAGAPLGGDGAGPAISVLGPRRMDYGRLLPLVAHATKLYGRYWAGL